MPIATVEIFRDDMVNLTEYLGQYVLELQNIALNDHGNFYVGLSDGVDPTLLTNALVGREGIRWSSW